MFVASCCRAAASAVPFPSGVWVEDYLLITSSLLRRNLRELNPGKLCPFWDLGDTRDWWMTCIDGTKAETVAGTAHGGDQGVVVGTGALMAVARCQLLLAR